MKKKVLGRGLDALIPDSGPGPGETLRELDLDLIDPNPVQPRMRSNFGDLEGLSASIRECGVIQPIIVRRKGARYQLIAGERRWMATQQAGYLKIPAIIRDVEDENLLQVTLVENIQRKELTALEEAQAYQELIQASLTQEEIAHKVGKDRATVANFLRLLKLPAEIQTWIQEGKLAMGHARPLLSLELSSEQIELAREAIQHGYSARMVEEKVDRILHRSGVKKKKSKNFLEDVNVESAISDLRHRLGTKVELIGERKRGKIILHYFSEEELERLFGLLTGK